MLVRQSWGLLLLEGLQHSEACTTLPNARADVLPGRRCEDTTAGHDRRTGCMHTGPTPPPAAATAAATVADSSRLTPFCSSSHSGRGLQAAAAAAPATAAATACQREGRRLRRTAIATATAERPGPRPAACRPHASRATDTDTDRQTASRLGATPSGPCHSWLDHPLTSSLLTACCAAARFSCACAPSPLVPPPCLCLESVTVPTWRARQGAALQPPRILDCSGVSREAVAGRRRPADDPGCSPPGRRPPPPADEQHSKQAGPGVCSPGSCSQLSGL